MSPTRTTARTTRLVALVAALALALAACGGSSDKKSKGGGGKGGTTAKLPPCPLDALAKASDPVEIVMWHSMNRANADALQKLADEFAASQPKVRVKLINQSTYEDTFNKFQAGLSTGDLPDVAQLEDTNLQAVIDSGAALPAQSCVNADKYDLSDHLKRVIDFWTVDGVMWPMPFNTSNPDLYYDKSDFTKAGLDPDKPPATLDDVTAAARKLKAAGIKVPLAFEIDPWYFEQMRAKAGQLMLNNENGRSKRATETVFDDATGKKIFEWLATLRKEGLARGYNRDQFDHLLAIGTGDTSMALETSAALGTVVEVLASGGQADKELEIGVGPLFAPPGKGGVTVGGAGLYLMGKSAPEKQAAAWEWLKFLNTAKAQAEWAAATGYIPNVTKALDEPVLKQRWGKIPEFKVAYDQLAKSPDTPATAGVVVGPYPAMRKKIEDQMAAVLNSGKDPAAALAQAKADDDALLTDYNSRVGR